VVVSLGAAAAAVPLAANPASIRAADVAATVRRRFDDDADGGSSALTASWADGVGS